MFWQHCDNWSITVSPWGLPRWLISYQDLICQHMTTILSVLRPCVRLFHVPHNETPINNHVLQYAKLFVPWNRLAYWAPSYIFIHIQISKALWETLFHIPYLNIARTLRQGPHTPNPSLPTQGKTMDSKGWGDPLYPSWGRLAGVPRLTACSAYEQLLSRNQFEMGRSNWSVDHIKLHLRIHSISWILISTIAPLSWGFPWYRSWLTVKMCHAINVSMGHWSIKQA